MADPQRREAVERGLRGSEFVLEVAATSQEALTLCGETHHAVVLCDVAPGGVDRQVLEALSAEHHGTQFILLAGDQPPALLGGGGLGDRVTSVLTTPWTEDDLLAALRRSVRLRHAGGSSPPQARGQAGSRVLLVEDDDDDAELVATCLRRAAGYQLTHVQDIRGALHELRQHRYDFVVCDLTLPDARGLDAVRRVQRVAPDAALILLSGVEDDAIALEAVQAGVHDFLLKNAIDGGTLIRALRHASERKAKEADLRQLASHDPLTGLANRARLRERVAELVARSRRTRERFGVLYVDLDGFKAVNDQIGHDAGDQVLIEVGRRIRAELREVDIVARLGGDEFAAVVDGVASSDDLAHAARRVLNALARPYGPHPAQAAITASIGVALSQGPDDSADALVRAADVAMYSAKRHRRNTVAIAPYVGLTATPADFERARRAGEFRLHYQVQVDRTGRRCGAEALLRWQRDDKLVPPGDFLPMLEASKEISAVGEWIIRSACRQAAAWHRQGLALSRIAVNVSPRQLDDRLASIIDDALRDSGLAPTQLEIEVTESAVMQRIDQASRVLGQLKELGLRIAMDDFGTGHSSLSNLYRLPFDVVKIDRSFVTDLIENPRARSVARAILALGRELGLEIVAEGIETSAQHAYLLREGCDLFQGYYFGRPTAPEHLGPAIVAAPAACAASPG